jgi:hypothetical protein
MILSFQFSTIGSRPMVENLKKNVVAAENEKVLPPKRLFFFFFPLTVRHSSVIESAIG